MEKENVDLASSSTDEVRSDPARKLRILCLHGIGTSGKIVEQQIARANWTPLIEDITELVFVDAPWSARKPFSLAEKFPGPYFEWFQSSDDYTEVFNVEKSISFVSDYMTSHGPFDGLLGFSQGGTFSAALIGLSQKGMAPKIMKDKFLIAVGAGRDKGIFFQPAYSDTIECPSFHFIGDKDFMKKYGEPLVSGFRDPVVIRHTYGHLFPRLTASEGKIFRDFLLKQLEAKFPSQKGSDPIKIASRL